MSYITVPLCQHCSRRRCRRALHRHPDAVKKVTLIVTAPRPRARFSPLWLPLFYVVAARDARSHRHSNTGFRRVVEVVASNGGIVWNAIRALASFSGLHTCHRPTLPLTLGNESQALTDEPADAVPPTGIAAFGRTRGLFTYHGFPVYRHDYGLLDLKLAASTSTYDSPRFRPPLASSLHDLPFGLGTVCVPDNTKNLRKDVASRQFFY
ncbi:hypothetical protein BDZ89DRAFT_1151283 [Hymenopellis radicata]|nr:hypothetical protein BDZ89DRAFT_1151283 [Hymenopellis radicata]